MTDNKQAGWGTILVIVLFVIYEAFTFIFQFLFFMTSDMIEIGFDLLFIFLLIFFYDIDAIILLIELVPFIDLIPLFVIYMLIKLATIDEPRKPLISMDWLNWDKKGSNKTSINENQSMVISPEEKVFYAVSNEEVCVICMQPLEDLDEVIICSNGHLAHVKHIQPWTESMNREYCPVCRVKYPKVLISKTYRKTISIE